MNPFINAEWIICDTEFTDIKDKAFVYKASFSALREKTTLYIAAHSQYAVYINGDFVDAGQYDDYEDYQVYDTLDITDFIKDGENELTVWHYVAGEGFSTRSKLIPGVIFSVFAEDTCLLSSDKNCLSVLDAHVLGLCEKVTRQLGYTLDFDATASLGEFKPSVSANKEKMLFPRPVKKLITESQVSGKLIDCGIFTDSERNNRKAVRMQKATLKKIEKSKLFVENEPLKWNVADSKADGIWLLYDCDESAGLLEFNLDLPEGTEVLIGYGEHLDDGRVRTAIGERNFCIRYIASEGNNKFFYPLFRLGLRYLSLYIYSKKGSAYYAGIRRQHYPLNKTNNIIENPLHRKIYEIGCNTLSLCMHEHYEDCPWREQALYTMDSRVQCLCGYYAFSEYEFPKANFRLIACSLGEDGLLDLCPPGEVIVNIPCFTAVFVRQIYEYVLYSGDLNLADELFEVLQKIVKGFLSRISENGLIPAYKGVGNWNFCEWNKGLDGLEDKLDSFAVLTEDIYELPLNAFISDAFSCFSKLCEKLEKLDLAQEYKKHSINLNKKMDEVFWCEESSAYRTRLLEKPMHELTQGLMLFVDAVPEEKKTAVTEHIKNGDYVASTLSMTIYVYDALMKADANNLEYVIKKIEKIWGAMIDKGCQTFWETELGADDFDGAGSLCHGWSAVPIYIFGKYLYKF